MRLILHIFRKDALHLWKEIGITWALLAWLTQLDCRRSGYLPDSSEGWLNLLLPLAWSYLAALSVLEDAVPGERQFWLALPARRGTVFAAKALFALVFIHAPYFVSSALVLGARGFNPWANLPHLFDKQLVVLVIVTIPALALASLARNAMRFVVLAIALAGAAVVGSGNGLSPFLPISWQPTDETRLALSLAITVLFGSAVLLIQYRSRRTRWSRGVGLAGVLVAGALYLWLPLRSSALLSAAWRPVKTKGPITVRAGGLLQRVDNPFLGRTGLAYSIPIEIDGLPVQNQLRFPHLDFEIDAPGGDRFFADQSRPGPGSSLVANLIGARPRSPDTYLLSVMIAKSLHDRMAHDPVTLRGDFVATETLKSEWHELSHAAPDVPGLGKCSVSRTESSLYLEGGLRIECESPDVLPRTSVLLTDTVTARHWDGGLEQARNVVSYPTLTWLSPINRGEAYFHLTSDEEAGKPASWWQVPLETAEHYRVELQTQRVTGTRVVSYELPGIQLSEFALKKAE